MGMSAALKGEPCHWLDPTQKDEPQECIYMIDKSLSSFAVKAVGRKLESFDITNLQDVSKYCAGTPFANIEDTDCVCMTIRGDGSAGSPALRHVGLLFPYARKQDEFYVGMKTSRKMVPVLKQGM